MKKQFQIVAGALCDDIYVQLKKQGLNYNTEDIKFLQRIADAITLLSVKGYIPQSAVDNARKRLIKDIGNKIAPLNKIKSVTKPTVVAE